jgi:hypothetical protein
MLRNFIEIGQRYRLWVSLAPFNGCTQVRRAYNSPIDHGCNLLMVISTLAAAGRMDNATQASILGV